MRSTWEWVDDDGAKHLVAVPRFDTVTGAAIGEQRYSFLLEVKKKEAFEQVAMSMSPSEVAPSDPYQDYISLQPQTPLLPVSDELVSVSPSSCSASSTEVSTGISAEVHNHGIASMIERWDDEIL